MYRTNVKLIILIFLGIMILTNCEDIVDDSVVSPEDSAAAAVLVEDANALLIPMLSDLFAADPDSAQMILGGLDLAVPNGFYSEALALDWRNQDANLGVGLTGMLILSQELIDNVFFGSIAEVYSPFSEPGMGSDPMGYGFGLPMSTSRVSGMIGAYYELPLSLARLEFEVIDDFNTFRTQVESDFLPMIDASILALDSLEGDMDYSFPLSDNAQLDMIDVSAIQTSLLALQGLFKSLIAYNYPLDTTDPVSIISDLSSGSIFGTLTEDGPELLSAAQEAAESAIEKALATLDLFTTWPPSEPHMLVNFDEGGLLQAQSALNALSAALGGPTDVEVGFANERGDFSAYGTISMDVGNYYTNPILDLKTLLPEYSMSTTIDYIYNEVSLDEQVNLEEAQVDIVGLNNTPVSVNFLYSESGGDTVATVTLGFLTYDLLTANASSLPTAIWDVWSQFLIVIADYTDEAYNFPEIDFHWEGLVTTGESLVINGTFSIDYLERVSEFTAPDIQWTAVNYSDWLAGWTNPTVNGLFPEFTAEDLAALLGVEWE